MRARIYHHQALIFSNLICCILICSVIATALSVESPSVYYGLGPFPIGNRELGSDILESFGKSIDDIWIDFKRNHYNSTVTYPSELADGGRVGWKRFNSDSSGNVQLNYDEKDGIRWDFLSAPMGQSVLQFYSWIFGEIQVESSAKVLINCMMCSEYFVDNIQLAGDRYGIGYGWTAIDLSSGTHTFKIRITGMQSKSFSLIINNNISSDIMVKNDIMLPTVVDGFIKGEYIGIPVINTGSDTLYKLTVSAVSNDGKELKVSLHADPTLHPGQTLLLAIKLHFTSGIDSFVLHINSEKGSTKVNISLSTVAPGNPFTYTFLDIDNTVQYALAYPPKNTCEQFPRKLCPVILTTHGAGSRSEWLMPSYTQQDYAWVVIPSGRRRYGYDWSGPQLINAYTTLHALPNVLSEKQNQTQRPDMERILFSGHSMGGHGCYVTSTRSPDYSLGSLCAAGWTTFQQYIAYYTRSDISFMDATLKGILDSSLYEYNPDLYADNLKGIPFLTRCGGSDEDVNPWHPRRMTRIYNQISGKYNAGNVSEIPGQGHWWNGIMDDSDMQRYLDQYLKPTSNNKPDLPETFTLTFMNPNGYHGRGGILPLQLEKPYRLGKIRVTREGDNWRMRTSNIQRFGFKQVFGIPQPKTINVDGNIHELKNYTLPHYHFCKFKAKWIVCNGEDWKQKERFAETYGPIRQVYERPFAIVVGTQGSPEELKRFVEYLVCDTLIF
jgi:hypothetical protein